jgi:hypothetical protein
VKRALAAVPVLVLLLASCGGGDEDDGGDDKAGLSADEQTAADNLAAQIVRSGSISGQGSAEGAVTEQESTCIAEGAVSEVGLKSLQDYGIVTEELLVNKDIQGIEMSADDGDALAGVFLDCIDAEALFEKQFLTALGTDSPGAEQCVEDAVDAESVREVLSASFQGRDTPAYERLSKMVRSCGSQKGTDE